MIKKRSLYKLISANYVPALAIVFLTCQDRKKSEIVWDKNLPVIGSQSSPRAADLNADGVLDIVMGAGKNEYQRAAQGIIALNGKTGELLWQQESPDQVYGAATFLDINGDGVKDVFIGGRSPHFKALDGKTGAVIWEYSYHYQQDPILKHARFNFNNSVLVPDQNDDGLQDLLTVNGGNSRAEPDSEKDRFPGVLILFDSKSGNIIAADTMPDGKESYMSPLCYSQPGSEDPSIVFGTGGETSGGHLYIGKLNDLLANRLSNAVILASEAGHGFISPPVLADINNDDVYDIISISHASTTFAVDGKSLQPLWKQSIADTESSNSFGVGYFTEDDVPDFFTFVSKGKWPNSTGSLQVLLDGKDGRIAYLDSMGCTGFSSPVVYDLDNDGRDEAIISINEFDCSVGFTGEAPKTVVNKLIVINFKKSTTQVIDQATGFKNIFTTPLVADIDNDGYLDIVHCQYFHYQDLLSFLGMRVRRIAIPIKVRNKVTWGSYMGSNGNSQHSR